MEISDIKKLTAYQDINDVLVMLTNGVRDILGDNIVGLYLTGSLTYGDFNLGSSDIDFLAIVKYPLTQEKLDELREMHAKIGAAYPRWAKRTEGSYITQDMLKNIEPPKTPRPYFNFGNLRAEANYGNEWLINLHVLYEKGTALFGPNPKEIIPNINLDDVREASKRDLYDEWIPKIDKDPGFFKNSHYKAYLILTLCRILYRAKHENVASKKVSSTWAKKEFGEPWKSLIEKAENWEHGKEINSSEGTKEFIKFVASQV